MLWLLVVTPLALSLPKWAPAPGLCTHQESFCSLDLDSRPSPPPSVLTDPPRARPTSCSAYIPSVFPLPPLQPRLPRPRVPGFLRSRSPPSPGSARPRITLPGFRRSHSEVGSARAPIRLLRREDPSPAFARAQAAWPDRVLGPVCRCCPSRRLLTGPAGLGVCAGARCGRPWLWTLFSFAAGA